MDFAGLTATGQTLMTLGYDGSTFTERYSPLLTIPLPGRDILALIQITYWPAAEIEKALQNSDWQCKETTTGRQLLWHRQLAVDIRITAGNNPDTTHKDADDMTPQHILITHHLLQFRLHIDTLDQVILGTTSQP